MEGKREKFIDKMITFYTNRKHRLQGLCDRAKERGDKTNVRVYRGQINLMDDFMGMLRQLKNNTK